MQLSRAEFNEIQKVVHGICGLVIPDGKEYLVTSRLEPVLAANGLASFEALVQRLKQPNTLLLKEQIIESITTNETSFNRDGHPFEELRRFIVPELVNRLLERGKSTMFPYHKVRVWCAAASTGQEACSVGMAIADVLAARSDRDQLVDRFSILATDISSKALARAREGQYSTFEVERGVTAHQRARYFQRQGSTWTVTSTVRRMLEFRRLNLIQDLPGVGMFDLVLCRNLMIYFDDATRRRVCHQLHAALVPQGILMIGAAESLFGVTNAFTIEHLGKTVVYRKH